MTMWRVGMLAVALETLKRRGEPPQIIEDHVYRVVKVIPDVFWIQGYRGPALALEGIQHLNGCGGSCVTKFRPAVQDWQSETQSKTSELDDMLKGRIPVRAS